MSWPDDKELSSGTDTINWNSLSKKKKKIYIPVKIIFCWFCYKKNVFPRKILPNIEAINEVHFIFGSCGHRVLLLGNLKVMYVYPIGKNEQTLNYWYLGNALAALVVLCEGGTRTTLTRQKKIIHAKKIYISNYFKLICFVTTLTWKYYIYIYIYIL